MQSPIPPAMVHCAVEWGLYKEAKERYNYVPPSHLVGGAPSVAQDL